MKARWHFLFVLALFGAIANIAARARAAEFPDQTIRLVVGFAAGGSGDLVARLVGQALSKQIGQPVVVDNRPGANTTIAADYVAHARPDGYTLLLYTSALTYPNHNKVDFDPIKSFAPILLVAQQPSVLDVSASLPVKSFQDLVALAKSQPGQLRYGTTGPQTPNDTMTKLVFERAGINLLGVPYTGEAPITTALLGNESQVAFMSYSSSAPQIQAGKLTALAVTTNDRSTMLPGVPTIAELIHYPDFDISFWYGVVAPAGIPDDVAKKLHDALATAVSSPGIGSAMAQNGLQVVASSSADFGAKLVRESAFWAANDK